MYTFTTVLGIIFTLYTSNISDIKSESEYYRELDNK